MALLDDVNSALNGLDAAAARNGAFLAIPHATDAQLQTVVTRVGTVVTKINADLDAAGADPVTPPAPTPTPTP